ncbi:HPF/RaiA family ribosome-associated protein, partial [Patescibacteria group bacterium]
IAFGIVIVISTFKSLATSHGGVASDLKVEITITMPKAIIRIEEAGDDFYVIIDKIDPILRRRLVRYHDHQKEWEGKESWKTVEMKKFNKELAKVPEDVYANEPYIHPVITKNKQLGSNSPMHPAEAIERMELVGHESFLFKNIKTGKYSMIYRKRDGTFGLVEPKDD